MKTDQPQRPGDANEAGELGRLSMIFAGNLRRLGLPAPDRIPSSWRDAFAGLLADRTAAEIEAIAGWLAANEYWRSRCMTPMAMRREFGRFWRQAADSGWLLPTRKAGERGEPSYERMRATLRRGGIAEDEIDELIAYRRELAREAGG